MSLRGLFCQPPSETKLFKGALLNNYDSLRENREGQEAPAICVRESPSGELTITVRVRSLTGATATVFQRVSPGFTLSIYPQSPETVAVHGLTRTVITLPPPELAAISISPNRRKILEKKYKNYKFATRAEAQDFAHCLLRMTVTASIEIHQMKLFEFNPTSRTLSQTHDAQRLEGGSDAIFLHLLRTHEGRQKMLLVRHIPKSSEQLKELNFGALVHVNRSTTLLLDDETTSFSCRFEGIRIRAQPGCTGFKRDGADSNSYDSGGGDIAELTFWSLEDKKKIEAFVKQGKGKLSKTTGPFKPIPVTTHELQASAPPDGTGVRFASRAAMSSVTLGDTRSSQVLSTLGPIEMEADIKDPAARR